MSDSSFDEFRRLQRFSYRTKGAILTQEVREGILRCLTDPLYMDAPLEEVADACETSITLVQNVLEDLRLRRCLTHARAVGDQLQLDIGPDAVIHMALEFMYNNAPEARKDRREMRWLLKQLKGSAPKR